MNQFTRQLTEVNYIKQPPRHPGSITLRTKQRSAVPESARGEFTSAGSSLSLDRPLVWIDNEHDLAHGLIGLEHFVRAGSFHEGE